MVSVNARMYRQTLILISLSAFVGEAARIQHAEIEDDSFNESEKASAKCPVEVKPHGHGDPSSKACCAGGQQLFHCVLQDGAKWQEHYQEWGKYFCWCDACKTVEQHTRITKQKATGFANDQHKPYELTTVDTYADLDPRVDGPLHDSQGKFVPGLKYVLFLYPTADHNGAFGFRGLFCQRISCWISRGYKVVMRRVASVLDASRVLDLFPEKSLHHVILGGHGASTQLFFGRAGSILPPALEAEASATNDFLMNLRGKLLVDASVTLDACSTAKDRGFDDWFIGSRIVHGIRYGNRAGGTLFNYVASKLPGRKVTASKVSLFDSMWKAPNSECIAGDNVVFIDDGENQTASRNAGRPNCKELSETEILDRAAKGLLCLSRCRSWCRNSVAEFSAALQAKVIATEVPGETVQYNPCWAGRKEVCRLSLK